MSKAIEKRIAVLEAAVGGLGIDLSAYDEEAILAKREAEVKAAQEAEEAAAKERAEADARAAAEAEAKAKEEEEIAARAQAIMEKRQADAKKGAKKDG